MKQTTVLAALVLGLVGYEAWTLNTQATGDTISEVVWSVSDRWPVVGLLFGLVMGHFFWPRRTVMGLVGTPAQPRQWHFTFEPAVWLGVVRAGIYLLAAFGFSLTSAQEGALIVFVELVMGAIQRSMVTPNAKLSTYTVEAAKDVPPNPPV